MNNYYNVYLSKNYYGGLKMTNNSLVPYSALKEIGSINNKSNTIRSTRTDKEISSSSINFDYYVYDGKGIPLEVREAHKAKYGFELVNGEQLLAWHRLRSRNHLNEEINNVLKENDIDLSPDESFSITVNSNGKILVNGLDDKEKRLKIEDALNNNIDAVNLFTHIDQVKQINGTSTTTRALYHKMYVRQIVQSCGQELEDLQLLGDEIVGANEQLKKLIDLAENGTDDYARTLKVHFDRLKIFLATGLEEIPDQELTIDFQDGSLIDRDVKYGFGPEQLKTWYNDVLSGKTRLNI